MVAKHFYEIAKSDLAAAKILYANESFHNAVFHLQQSVEKAVKALNLASGIADFDEIKDKIGHRTLKLFGKAVDNSIAQAEQAIKLQQVVPQLFFGIGQRDFKKHLSSLKTSRSKIDDLHSTPAWEVEDEEFHSIFHHFREIENSFDDLIFTDEVWSDFQQKMLKMLNGLDELTLIAEKKEELEEAKAIFQNREIAEPLFSALFQDIKNRVLLAEVLFFLSALANPHEGESRYPCAHCGHHPLNHYQTDLPLVKHFPEMVVWLERVYAILDEVFYPAVTDVELIQN